MLHATGKKNPIQSDFYKEESYVVIQGIQNICGPRGSLSYYIVIHGMVPLESAVSLCFPEKENLAILILFFFLQVGIC